VLAPNYNNAGSNTKITHKDKVTKAFNSFSVKVNINKSMLNTPKYKLEGEMANKKHLLEAKLGYCKNKLLGVQVKNQSTSVKSFAIQFTGVFNYIMYLLFSKILMLTLRKTV
jgi:hypothetical protein